MSRIVLACALVALVPVAARGEPISVAVHSTSGGMTQSGTLRGGNSTIDLGQVGLVPGSSGTFFFNNARRWMDYQLSFDVTLGNGVTGFVVELLDPLGDGDDKFDPISQPSYVPAGYSTSNDVDYISFAQGSGLRRTATWAGGAGMVEADEITHRGDLLIFSGLGGVDLARVTFGIRESLGSRGFLMRIAALSNNSTHAPEPATMVLLGTGLAGLAAARRRRRAAARTGDLAS